MNMTIMKIRIDDPRVRCEMTPAGLEPANPGSVGRCLIHWATGPCLRSLAISSGTAYMRPLRKSESAWIWPVTSRGALCENATLHARYSASSGHLRHVTFHLHRTQHNQASALLAAAADACCCGLLPMAAAADPTSPESCSSPGREHQGTPRSPESRSREITPLISRRSIWYLFHISTECPGPPPPQRAVPPRAESTRAPPLPREPLP